MLNTFNAIAETPECQELIKKIHETKLNQELKEIQEESEKLKAEITKEHPIPNKVKSDPLQFFGKDHIVSKPNLCS